MLTLLNEVATYLQSVAIGVRGKTLFVGQIPNSPIGVTVVVGGVGLRDPLETGLRKPSFQVIVRDVVYQSAQDRSDLVRRALDNKWNVLGSIKGRVLAETEGPIAFRDQNNHPSFSHNFALTTTLTNTL